MKHVEVKGTRTGGQEVILTPNEVKHARTYNEVALFIVRNISVERNEHGAVEATGGEIYLLDPWVISQGALKPIGYRHEAPEGGDLF